MIMLAGGLTPALFTFDGMLERLPVMVLCFGVVPSCITATGVFGSIPPATSSSHMAPILESPIITTMVSTDFARRLHFTASLFFSGSSWPVTNTTDDECFLCVSGIPEYVADPMPDVTPGTISYLMLLLLRNSASSPPLPNITGSPPFSRTMRLFLPACLSIASFVSLWWVVGSPTARPTYSFSADFGAMFRIFLLTSLSYSTTSAFCSSSTARTVISLGSPGPAPTR